MAHFVGPSDLILVTREPVNVVNVLRLLKVSLHFVSDVQFHKSISLFPGYSPLSATRQTCPLVHMMRLRFCDVQLAQFSLCVIAARICCGVVVITGASVLATFAAALDSPFQGHPTALLFFVMVAFPVMMNTIQALIQDQFLKWRSHDTSGASGTPLYFPGLA